MSTRKPLNVGIVGIVDANPTERAALRDQLKRMGVRVVVYSTAERFFEGYRKGRFVCLMVSLSLPPTSGLDLLRKLRASDDDVPVVLLANHADVSTAVEAMREGAVDFIEAPYNPAAILKTVRRLLHDPRPAAGW